MAEADIQIDEEQPQNVRVVNSEKYTLEKAKLSKTFFEDIEPVGFDTAAMVFFMVRITQDINETEREVYLFGLGSILSTLINEFVMNKRK